MRAVLVHVGTSFIEQILHGHEYSRLETDFPADAEIVYALWNQDKNQLVLTVTSATYADVPDGSYLPNWSPTVTVYQDEAARLIDIVHRSMAEND
jgi:hypothetical protein